MIFLQGLLCCAVVVVAVSSITTSCCSAFGVAPLPATSNRCCVSRANGRCILHSLGRQTWPPPPILFVIVSLSIRSDATGNGSDSESKSNPSNWFSDTKPFSVVRHFAPKPEVADDEIEQALKVNAIRTLRHLKEKGNIFIPILRPGCFADFGSAIINALSRIRKTAEQVLGEAEIIYDTSCITENAYKSYSPSAVSVKPSAFQATSDNQNPKFSLVMGSSGSGKTMFAIRRIPELLWSTDVSSYFRIHFRASAARKFRNEFSKNNPGQISFPQAVAMMVKGIILKQLAGKGLDGVQTLSIPLHVTLDEAGEEDFKNYIDSADKILSIVEAIQEEGAFHFQRDIHVTVAGTQLEPSTGDIRTTPDTPKFRMQPWAAENFDALVDASPHEQKVRVKQVVHGYPILEDLASNARCAFFILTSLKNDTLMLRENRVRSSVTMLVSSVADRYITNNGLGDLVGVKEKWSVARSAFRELDKSSKNPGLAFFPRFEDLAKERLRLIASSLLDVNVESEDGHPVLVPDFGYAVPMSPALAIVVANLLISDAKISLSWEGLETSVMLSELKRLIVNSEDTPKDLDGLVLQLPSALPAGPASKTFSVPIVGRYTVVLNGPLAKYADVIAPYRLVQTKFSKDNNKALFLDLQNELNKMGLTRSKKHVMQQWITTVFHVFWDFGVDSGLSWLKAESLLNLVNKNCRQEYYPFNTLNSKLTFQYPRTVQGIKVQDEWLIRWAPTDEKFDWLAAFNGRCPITAVFATNCKAFKFNVKRERKEGDKVVEYEERIILSREDTDFEGIWMPDGDQFAKLCLRDGVQIRFIFC